VRVQPEESRYDRLTWFHAYRRIKAHSVVGRLVVADTFVMGISLSRSLLSPFSEADARTMSDVYPLMKIGEELQRRRTAATAGSDDDLGLGRRESEVTDLVCKGLRNSEIAPLLGISPNTVRNILVNIFRKLGVTTRSELVMVRSGADADAGPVRLVDGLKRADNPARGLIGAALGLNRPVATPRLAASMAMRGR
jgi:DNA-binding CsgD family transcriptional regulator